MFFLFLFYQACRAHDAYLRMTPMGYPSALHRPEYYLNGRYTVLALTLVLEL